MASLIIPDRDVTEPSIISHARPCKAAIRLLYEGSDYAQVPGFHRYCCALETINEMSRGYTCLPAGLYRHGVSHSGTRQCSLRAI
jgi:hypothetical protein